MRSPIALTGTPGTGKSAVAARLARRFRVIEVADLAERRGAARRVRGELEVDLVRLRRSLRRPSAWEGAEVVVGHLAHLLPLREVIVLRCHPLELVERLRAADRGTARERTENAIAEVLDVVLVEAIRSRRRVVEVDTSGRSIAAVARDVARFVARRGRPSYGRVDWLSDPRVTAHLLDPAR